MSVATLEAHHLVGEAVLAGPTTDVIEPATGRLLGAVAHPDPADAARIAAEAADAAALAFERWAAYSPRARADILLAAVDALDARRDELGALLARETGKPVAEAHGELALSSEYLRWFAEEARRPSGTVHTAEDPRRQHISTHRPLGVVASLTPWNFPVSIQARKLAPALAAGCAVVARVSEKAPLAVSQWIATLRDAGLPAGVLNLVHGPGRVVTDTLLDHPAVRGVSFTGSTAVGAQVMARAARRIVRPLLELGGDAPFIVRADADLDAAWDAAMVAKLRNAGQSCVGANRFLVHADIVDEFATGLAARFDALDLGDPFIDRTVGLGPVIDAERVRAMDNLVAEAVAGGARLLTTRDDVPEEGTYTRPRVVTDIPIGCGLATQEVFGPVAGIFPFTSDDEAVALANRTEYGLAAYVVGRDVASCWDIADRLDVGVVGINDPLPTTAFVPMGGVKRTGLGREGAADGLRDYQETRYVLWRR